MGALVIGIALLAEFLLICVQEERYRIHDEQLKDIMERINDLEVECYDEAVIPVCEDVIHGDFMGVMKNEGISKRN